MITTRHIRHDWQTWVDWDQKTVRTLCGTTTRRGLAGIPGVTGQDMVVYRGDNVRVLGWCWRCAKVLERKIPYLMPQVEDYVLNRRYEAALNIAKATLRLEKGSSRSGKKLGERIIASPPS